MIDAKLEEFLSLKALGGDLAKLYDAVQDGRDCMAFSLGMPERAHVASHLDKFVLYVAKDSLAADKAFSLVDGTSDGAVRLIAREETLLYNKRSQKSLAGERVRALSEILDGKAKICVTYAQALLQRYPLPNDLKRSVITLRRGEKCDMYRIIDTLAAMGYSREDAATEKGTFSVAGDVLGVFCPDRQLPYRISFFADEIESIKVFDADSLMSLSEEEEIVLYPDNDVLASPAQIAEALKKAVAISRVVSPTAARRLEEITDDIALYSVCGEYANWLTPFLPRGRVTLFDYLPDDAVIVFDEPSSVDAEIRGALKRHAESVKALSVEGEVTKRHVDMLLSEDEFSRGGGRFAKLGFSQLVSTNRLIAPQTVVNIRCSPLGAYSASYNALIDDLRNFVNGGFRVIICMGDVAAAAALADNLRAEDVPCSVGEVIKDEVGISVTPFALSRGFAYPAAKTAFIGRDDIVRRQAVRIGSKKSVFTLPSPGDFVVHESHGIGRCLGVKRVRTGETEKDYCVVEYAKNGVLYVPVDQLDRLSRYSGGEREPKLSEIGGREFEKLKERVRASVKDMAINLLDIYKKRQNSKGHKYQQDTPWQTEFEASFEFKETPDQLDAVNDIKRDMERGIIMDRLLCGDVGYGKTEVALRAVFKTVMENKQAIILAPTTILAKQHYNTAMSRFDSYKFKVELLTRFQSRDEITASLKRLETGESLIAVGTHRLLSKDVRFKDLGLMVLDEEQRFGVEHKEKLKSIKTGINVLSLSATPIPRTLNMAMTGIRDISVLETPPVNRLPVQTAVTELTDGLIQDSVRRELSRGGQVFILRNRIADIEKFAAHVSRLVPEADVVIGHARMSDEQLENNINAFYDKRANVLVCTTIIENGIDIPDANTLIVCDADRLGLAQLYQLRGRVGRSSRTAYAYFTVPEGKVLDGDAAKRLGAILDFTQLGSGFKIAMRDLEIRGAGTLLGRDQHGHIEKVGYDLYCKLLQESVDELSGNPIRNTDVEIVSCVDGYIDSDYIYDENDRMKVYRGVLELDSGKAREEFIKSLKETFGAPPAPLINLIDIGLVKNLASKLGVKKVLIQPKTAGLVFRDGGCYAVREIFDVLETLGDKASLNNDDEPKLTFDCRYMTGVQKLRFLREFLLKCVKTKA